jgi:hypothetical protein
MPDVGRQLAIQQVNLTPMIRSFPSTKIVRLVLAPILSLWIAGAGCLMGCEGMVAAAATVPSSMPAEPSRHYSARRVTIVASSRACSSTGSHGCCAKKDRKAKPEVKQTSHSDTTRVELGESPSGMMKDCPLAVGRAIAAKIRANEIAAAPVLAHSTLPGEKILELTSPLSAPPRLPNRGHTYLHCCVFLI